MTLAVVGLKALRCLSRDVDGNDPEDFPLWFKRIRKEGSRPESIAPFERRSMPADDFLGTGLTKGALQLSWKQISLEHTRQFGLLIYRVPSPW